MSDDLIQSALETYLAELEVLSAVMGTNEARTDHYRDVSLLALEATRKFIRNADTQVREAELGRVFFPLANALIDLKSTHAVPDMFDIKSMSRPPAGMKERFFRYYCVFLQELYRAAGEGRRSAAVRLRARIDVKKTQLAVPTVRTLESWFDNCQVNRVWHTEYSNLMKAWSPPSKMPDPLDSGAVDRLATEIFNGL